MVDFDPERVYYTYEIKRAENGILNPNKMLFMYNQQNPKASVHVEDIQKESFDSVFELDELLEEVTMCSTSTILGE